MNTYDYHHNLTIPQQHKSPISLKESCSSTLKSSMLKKYRPLLMNDAKQKYHKGAQAVLDFLTSAEVPESDSQRKIIQWCISNKAPDLLACFAAICEISELKDVN